MRALIFAVLLGALAVPARALQAPQYYVHAQIRAAFEGGAIKVLELEQANGYWVVPVALSGPEAWEINDGLATVLNRTFLNGSVRIEVRLPAGARPRAAPREPGLAGAVRTLSAALRGNPHVSGVFEHNGAVLIELRPRMISFFADNISDRRGFAHFAPAELFASFLDFSPFTATQVRYSYSAE